MGSKELALKSCGESLTKGRLPGFLVTGPEHLHFSKQGRRFLNSSPSWEILEVTELVDPHALRKQMDLVK